MRKISQKNREIIAADQYYRSCARSDEGNCRGRVTIEHSIIYAGRQIDDLWSLLPICEYHHGVNKFQDGGDMNKEKHVWLALNRATDDELRKYSKAVDYIALRERLNKKYG
jgi:hypothetical protein